MQDYRNSWVQSSECSIYILFCLFCLFLLIWFYYFAKGGELMRDQPLASARPPLRSETLVVYQHFIFFPIFLPFLCFGLGVGYQIFWVRYCLFTLFLNLSSLQASSNWYPLAHTIPLLSLLFWNTLDNSSQHDGYCLFSCIKVHF